MIATLLVSGCVSATKVSPIETFCSALSVPTNSHSVALEKDGGPESLVTGVRLIATIDAGCS